MPDRPSMSGYPPAAPADVPPGRGSRVPAVRVTVRRIVGGWPVRWGFAAAAVAVGGYAVARQWTDVRAALASIGVMVAAAAMISVLLAMFAAMQVWRVLLAALGSPVPVRVGARILFVGQLGKYLDRKSVV
jgi:glycosyltransferase 2 family protein